jgi:hypothetical protein
MESIVSDYNSPDDKEEISEEEGASLW